MAKKKGRRRKGGRTTPKGTRPPGSGPPPHLSLVPDPLDDPLGLGAGRLGLGPFATGDGGPRFGDDPFDLDDDLFGDELDDLDDPGHPLDVLAGAMATGEPYDLLAEVSSMVAAFEWARDDPFSRHDPDDDDPEPTLADLIRLMGEIDEPEPTALLAVAAELAHDDNVRAEARRAAGRRRHPLPEWVGGLGAMAVERCVEQLHPLADGENLLLELSLPGDHHLAVVAYVDHNLGTLVKDAFVVPGTIDDLIAQMRRIDDDPDFAWRDIDPADARARIEAANQVGDMTWPPFETDTWPACRPILEWARRRLPEGGRGYDRHEWTDDERDALMADVLASPFAAGFDREDDLELLDSLLWYGTGYGTCDPLRWSGTRVELLLLDWLPRKIVAPVAHLQKAPDVLRALIRFGHDRAGISPSLTAETLAAVDEFEPDYQQAIRSPRPQGVNAILAAAGALDPDAAVDPALIAQLGDELGIDLLGGGDLDDDRFTDDMFDDRFDDERPWSEQMLDGARAAVGGEEALVALDDEPLPDEPLDLAGVADDITDRVSEVSALADGACDALLDVEHRTAARRVVADVARADPAVFRRKARAETAAAAVCWIVVEANRVIRFGPRDGLAIRDLNEHFGLGSTSAGQRAPTFLKALGVDHQGYRQLGLGTTRYLVSARRRQLADQRDRLRVPDP